MNRLTVGLLLTGVAGFVIVGTLMLWVAVDSPPEVAQGERLIHRNFVILLDLSDRIDTVKAPNQVRRDKEIIQAAFSIFEKGVKKKLYVNSKDIFQIAIAFQPSNYDTSVLLSSRDLRIDMGRMKVTEKRARFPELKDSLFRDISTLYGKAVRNSKFMGSDIWTFFRDDMDNYVAPSKKDSIKNIVIILTDGYLEFEKSVLSSRPHEGNRASYMEMSRLRGNPNWESLFENKKIGLIPVRKDFSNLGIIMLEVTPRNPLDPTEFSKIQKYWNSWFNDMNIKTTDHTINKNQLPVPKVAELLERFVEEN